jgi:hypothetical protein
VKAGRRRSSASATALITYLFASMPSLTRRCEIIEASIDLRAEEVHGRTSITPRAER